jgi:hypothetical protein
MLERTVLADDISKAIQANDHKAFQSLFVRSQQLLNMNEQELSVLFEVSRNSIRRWLAGATTPAMWKIVLKWVCEELEKISHQNPSP